MHYHYYRSCGIIHCQKLLSLTQINENKKCEILATLIINNLTIKDLYLGNSNLQAQIAMTYQDLKGWWVQKYLNTYKKER